MSSTARPTCPTHHTRPRRRSAAGRRVLLLATAAVLSQPALGWASALAPRAFQAAAVAAPPRLAPAVPVANDALPPDWTSTQWGPVTPAGRTLVQNVRRADLWEGPAGQMATLKGASPRIREIGATIAKQHVDEIDPQVHEVAQLLGIPLPDRPNEQQSHWLDELQHASGADFDRIFVNRLRVAHSGVFTLIATVRANSRNSKIRDFAQLANRYVDGHIAMLDSTGLVDYDGLPTPQPPAPAAAAARAPADPVAPHGLRMLGFAIALLAAFGTGAAIVFHVSLRR